ncbi:MAG TPA: hypothetical protein VG273_11970 [Bryobacteraceae bacterium]|jgi:transposase InsO family protein|nr:hypothetical protein [Bryobacteraceae bacterium]
MAGKALLRTSEVAEALGVSERHARRISPGQIAATGRRETELKDLPPDAQLEWSRRNKVVAMSPKAAPGQLALSLTVPTGPNLSPEDRIEVDKRYRVIEPLLKPEGFVSIWAQNKNSRVKVIDWLAKQHKTKRRTVYNWLTAWKQGGLPALVPKDRSDKGKPKALNPAALDFLVAAAFPKHGAYGKLTVRDIYRAYGEERDWRAKHQTKPLGDMERSKYARYITTDGYLAPSAQLPEASYGTFRNWFERIPEIARVMAREGDEAFNTQEIISFRDLSSVKPLDYLVMDHRRLDIFCLVPDGKNGWSLARPWLTAAIDMRTRKWMGWAIVETPSSDSIATVLKRSFLSHGLPVACYWDNGKDFRCEWLEGGSARTETRKAGELDKVFRGVLDTLGIRVHHAIVKRARSKIIEPNFGRTADFDRTLPWWCGHNPIARPSERFDKLLVQHERWLMGEAAPAFPTINEVAAFYEDHLNELNERAMEGAEGMNKITPTGRGWMCPNEAWERLAPQVTRREVPEDVLHLCFAKRRKLTIRGGAIHATFGGEKWHYRLASNEMRLMAFNGCEVELAYDPLDLQTAAVYHESRLLGLVECLELRRMGEETFIADEKMRRIGRRETKRFIANVHEQVYIPDHTERAARRAAVEPRREPARRTVQAALPGAIADTVAAIAENNARPEAISVEKVAAPPAADDNFDFFA